MRSLAVLAVAHLLPFTLTWGAIPHDGHIFASDIDTGVWVARVTGAPVP